MSYTAVRGASDEEGAVQRLLNPRRIASVKEFTIAVGHYPGTVVLNWVNASNPVVENDGILRIRAMERSAQIIDGQHRIAGIKAAISEKPEIGDMLLAVAIYQT